MITIVLMHTGISYTGLGSPSFPSRSIRDLIGLHFVLAYYCIQLEILAGIKSAVEPKIAIARILADLNLAVWYRIAIRIYASRKFWLGSCNIDPPNRQIFRLYGNFMQFTYQLWLDLSHIPVFRPHLAPMPTAEHFGPLQGYDHLQQSTRVQPLNPSYWIPTARSLCVACH